MRRVLVIDDDRDLTAMLVEYLQAEDLEVESVHTGEEGLSRALSSEYSLIILDVMLPRMNGIEVLRQLRTRSQCPVIMLTARGQEIDRVVGLEIGADDYLSKPFSARELLARMNAVLRRARPSQAADGTGEITVGDVTLNSQARTVHCKGELVELTSLEFEVLQLLLTSAGNVVPREDLFLRVLQREYSVLDRSIDNHVSSLRRKLGPRVGEVERIRSVRNVGYLYARTPRARP